jgi:RNA polymerase sigma-70 factor (ECF subfamily)
MPDDLDGDLLRRFVRGEAPAFEALFRQTQAELYRWLVRIVRDAGLAEAYWRAYRGRARFDPARSFGAWLRRIATNVALDQLRAARGRPAWLPLDERAPAPPGPDAGTAQAVALAFGRLPPKLRFVATLALVEGRPYSEIADALDVPVGTIKSRVSRALLRLRGDLARLGVRP